MKTSLFILISAVVFVSFTNKEPAASNSLPPNDTMSGFRVHANNAWGTGEQLEYRVHYGLINAGEIVMRVENNIEKVRERQAYHINATGRSYSGFDWFYKVRDRYETFIDKQAIVPLKYVKQIEEGSYKDNDFAIFNHDLKKVFAKKGNIDIPANVQDVISAIYYARTLNLKDAKAGDVFPIEVYLDGEIFALGIKYLGRETIKTDIGKVNAIKIQPLVVADRVFKEKDGLMLWVSDDDNKVPLRIKAELMVGSLKVDITKTSGLKHQLNKQ